MAKQNLKFAAAFRATQDARNIGTTALAEASGVHKSKIFEFRRVGTGVSLEKLETLLETMEEMSTGAFDEYTRRLRQAGNAQSPQIDVSQLSQAEMAKLLFAIGKEITDRNGVPEGAAAA